MSSLHLFKREDTYPVPSKNFLKLQAKTAKAKSFARDKNFNTNFCFLIDMSLPSYQNRFFIYDLIKDSTKNSGLVTHGRCNEDWRKEENTAIHQGAAVHLLAGTKSAAITKAGLD